MPARLTSPLGLCPPSETETESESEYQTLQRQSDELS